MRERPSGVCVAWDVTRSPRIAGFTRSPANWTAGPARATILVSLTNSCKRENGRDGDRARRSGAGHDSRSPPLGGDPPAPASPQGGRAERADGAAALRALSDRLRRAADPHGAGRRRAGAAADDEPDRGRAGRG